MTARGYTLWGFRPGDPDVTPLATGGLREVRAKGAERRTEGWTTALYRAEVEPRGLRARATLPPAMTASQRRLARKAAAQ